MKGNTVNMFKNETSSEGYKRKDTATPLDTTGKKVKTDFAAGRYRPVKETVVQQLMLEANKYTIAHNNIEKAIIECKFLHCGGECKQVALKHALTLLHAYKDYGLASPQAKKAWKTLATDAYTNPATRDLLRHLGMVNKDEIPSDYEEDTGHLSQHKDISEPDNEQNRPYLDSPGTSSQIEPPVSTATSIEIESNILHQQIDKSLSTIRAREILNNTKKDFESKEYITKLKGTIKYLTNYSHPTTENNHADYGPWKALREGYSKDPDDIKNGNTSIMESLRIFRDRNSYPTGKTVEMNVANILQRWDTLNLVIQGRLKEIGIEELKDQ